MEVLKKDEWTRIDCKTAILPAAQSTCHRCTSCKKGFPFKSSLIRHQLTHSENKPFKCDLCNVAFSLNGNLKKHHDVVHRREYKYKFNCIFCQKPFESMCHLGRHLSKHVKEKPFFCSKCPFESTTSANLKKHTEIHKMKRERKFECGICQKGFFTYGDLTGHIICHTGEKYFKCNVCNKSFRTGYQLNCHKRIHTGEGLFACNICPKRFSLRGNLRQHQARHSQMETPLR